MKAMDNVLRRMPLKWQLMFMVIFSCLATLIIAIALFIIADLTVVYKNLAKEIQVNASVAAEQSSAALLFGDSKTAEDIVAAFGAEEHIQRILVLDHDKKLFASYVAPNASASTIPDFKDPFPDLLWTNSSHVRFQPVVMNSKTIGWIVIESDLSMIYDRYRLYGVLSLVILFVWAPVSFLLAARLQGLISEPLSDLAKVARQVSLQRDYAHRALGDYAYELGDLFKAFNEMLAQIQAKDRRLEDHAAQLEAKVAERTRDLEGAKERAEKATAMKDKYVSLVSHDLRSPIASILGILGLMTNLPEIKQSPKSTDLTLRASNSAKRLLRMIDILLDIGRLQTGRMMLAKERIKPAQIIDQQIEGILALANSKGIVLENKIPAEMEIFADQNLFNQLILNLLSNAVKFLRGGDKVTIYQPRDLPGAIVVQDTGPGVDSDLLPHLLDSSVKTSTTGTSGERGTGLGLPYCREIIEAHGGSIRVESIQGQGAKFTMEFPPVCALILLVDDQPAQILMLKQILSRIEGVDFIEAENGKQAMELADKFTPDLVITDMNMPVMNGFELLSALKEVSPSKKIPVIAASSISDSHGRSARKLALESGALDFVQKPVDEEDLLRRVRDVLKLNKAPGAQGVS